MTHNQRMLATLNGGETDYVPSWTQAFFSEETVRKLIPAELISADLERFAGSDEDPFVPHSPDELEKLLALNAYIDREVVGVGRGTNLFGHGGPGEFAAWLIEQTPQHKVVQYETGAKAEFLFDPHRYHTFDHPVCSHADLEALDLPDPENPARWHGFRQDVQYLKSTGAYTVGYLNGFFSGCHYFFTDLAEFLINMLENPELVTATVQRLGEWNLAAARMMLEAGIDCISLADDLGTGENLLFHPRNYDRWFFPWHQAVAELAHQYGAHVHLHSHGNIMTLLDRIVATGIDMLNPLDQTEGMDLATIKARYGDRITLVGGMNRMVFEMSPTEMEAHLRHTVEVGKPGGRYILMDTGGIPDTLSLETFNNYLAISRRVRGHLEH